MLEVAEAETTRIRIAAESLIKSMRGTSYIELDASQALIAALSNGSRDRRAEEGG